jgi:hypothetical protein
MVRYFSSYSLTTLFLGWWGVISFVVTPFILLNNIFQYLSASQLPDPGIGAMNTPSPLASPSVSSGSFKFKIIYGTVVWAVVMITLAYMNVGFMEKHAPAINARLHGGEISDETDYEYAGTKIWKDVAALDADLKSKDWDALRSEILARESYLSDLNAQNDRLQPALAKERSENRGANNVCEQLALDEMSPALDAYTKAQNKLFVFVKATAQITKENQAQLQQLSTQEDSAFGQLNRFITDSHKQGCDK